MYKHIVSISQRRYHVGLVLFDLACSSLVGLCIYQVFKQKLGDEYLLLMMIPFAVTILTLFGLIQTFIVDPILGTISFDPYAVTLYAPLSTITFPYNECVEMGFTKWFGAGGVINYIYLSKKQLTDEQKSHLFPERSRRNKTIQNMPAYKKEYILFQYTPEVFEEFVKFVPKLFLEKLLFEETQLTIT